MRSSFLSVSVVGMALANFTTSFPHGIGSVNTAVGGKPAPQLLRRALGEKRQDATGSSGYGQDYKRMKPLARNLMENDNDIMKMVRSEADYSAFLTTFSLPGKCRRSYGEQIQPDPTLSILGNHYAELKDWANSVEYVPSSQMVPEDFAIMFPMVARALKAGTGEIPELDTLIVRVNSIDYGPGHDSVSSGLPDLVSTNLPNDLTRQTLRRIPYLVQSHLAAHFVVHKNLGGFKQIIRSWIASDRNDPTPSSSTPVFEDSKLELTNMPLTGGVLDVGLGSLDSILAIRSQGFDPQNNDPLDTSGDYPLYNGRSRLPIATLFMWALEYEIIEAEELFTEFGNPFLKRDLPCFLALGFQVTYSSVGLDYNDEPLLSPKEQFGCYQQFTFQGYIAMPPNDHEPESVEIWVRHNRKLNPEEGLEPGDDGETTATLEKKLGELLELVDDSEDLQDLDEIDTRIYPILTWARSFGTAIHYLKNSTLAESTGINQETTYRNESPIPIAPEDLIRGVNKIIELLKFLMSKIEMRESYLTSIDGKMDTVMADVAEEDSISYSSESEQDDDLVDTIHTMADDILVELTNGLQILSEKYLFRAAILEGLKGYQTPVNI